MKRKIVIIRGKVTAGKSTTSYELAKVLPGWIFIDVWKIKEMFEPLGLKDRTCLISSSKKAMIVIMREVIRNMGVNILVQETTQTFIRKNLGQDIRKNHYEVHSFFLDNELNDAVKRDITRDKPSMHLGKKIKTNKEWKQTKGLPERGDLIINTSKHNVNEVVSIILNELKEKRRRHPYAHLIRKCW